MSLPQIPVSAATEARVAIRAHPPERAPQRTVTLCCGCCCCCCCCLHSVGGLIGAAVGSAVGSGAAAAANSKAYPVGRLRYTDVLYIPEEALGASSAPAGAVYWWTLLAVSLLIMMIAGGAGILIVAMTLPFIQLGASVVAVIVLSLASPPNPRAAFARLGRITGYSFLGGVIGTALMFLIGIALSK